MDRETRYTDVTINLDCGKGSTCWKIISFCFIASHWDRHWHPHRNVDGTRWLSETTVWARAYGNFSMTQTVLRGAGLCSIKLGMLTPGRFLTKQKAEPAGCPLRTEFFWHWLPGEHTPSPTMAPTQPRHTAWSKPVIRVVRTLCVMTEGKLL